MTVQYNVITMEGKRVALFYSYSHKDEAMRQRLETHLSLLKRSGAIAEWHDRKIGAGDDWERQISGHFETADIILLLISSDFLASDYCFNIEAKRALERHQRGEAVVIPVILHPVDWAEAPFAQLQALPRNARPVSKWSSRDEAFADIAIGIRAAVDRLSSKTAPLPLSVEVWTAERRAAVPDNSAPPAGAVKYPIGTRIVVRFRANRDCYLTLLNLGTSGKCTVLFPNALHAGDHVQAGRLYEIPGPEDSFEYQITGPPGLERLKAIATLEKVPLMPEQLASDGSLFRTMSPTAAARDIAVVQQRAAGIAPGGVSEREWQFTVV